MITVVKERNNICTVAIDDIEYIYNMNLMGDYSMYVNLTLGLDNLVSSSMYPCCTTIDMPFKHNRQDRICIVKTNEDTVLADYYYHNLTEANRLIRYKKLALSDNEYTYKQLASEVKELRKNIVNFI